MKIANTTEDFGRCTAFNYEDCVRYTHEAGFQYIDLSMYVVQQNDPLFYSPCWQEYAYKLRYLGEQLGIRYVQAHSPSGNPYLSAEQYDAYLYKTIRAIEVCSVLGIPNVVVHMGVQHGLYKDEFQKMSGAFVQKLIPTMEKHGVNVLCENGRKTDAYYDLYSGAEMREFIEYVNHPLFHGCWDTGHANMIGSQYDDIMTLGKDLYALHVNDNRGTLDEHMIPFFGTINMDEVMTALLDSGYKGYFTFEATYSLRPADLYFGPRRKFEKETRLYSPSLEMQKDMAAFMYKMGQHILKVYDCYEE